MSTKSEIQRESLETNSEQFRISGLGARSQLARIGSETSFIGPEPALGVYAGAIVKILRQKSEEGYHKAWNELQSCRQRVFWRVQFANHLVFPEYEQERVIVVLDNIWTRAETCPKRQKPSLVHCLVLSELRTKHLRDFYIPPDDFRNAAQIGIQLVAGYF